MEKSRQFQTFNDGTISIRLINDDGDAGEEQEHLRFQDRTVGATRFYSAMAAKVRVDRLVRVPYRPWLTTEYLAVIEGEVYEIKQAQLVPDARPKSSDLSLHIARQRRVEDGNL